MTDAKQLEELRKKIVDILGLETDPFGDPEHLIIKDGSGNPIDGVDYRDEVTALLALIEQETRRARVDEIYELKEVAYRIKGAYPEWSYLKDRLAALTSPQEEADNE